jgi:hypothetical protein
MRRGYKKGRFIMCPECGSKSRKLYSEMGGLQTRQCSNKKCETLFEYDTFSSLSRWF